MGLKSVDGFCTLRTRRISCSSSEENTADELVWFTDRKTLAMVHS